MRFENKKGIECPVCFEVYTWSDLHSGAQDEPDIDLEYSISCTRCETQITIKVSEDSKETITRQPAVVHEPKEEILETSEQRKLWKIPMGIKTTKSLVVYQNRTIPIEHITILERTIVINHAIPEKFS